MPVPETPSGFDTVTGPSTGDESGTLSRRILVPSGNVIGSTPRLVTSIVHASDSPSVNLPSTSFVLIAATSLIGRVLVKENATVGPEPAEAVTSYGPPTTALAVGVIVA